MKEGKKLFLLSFSFKGIKNIREEVPIRFYKNNITKDFSSDKYRIKGIYGENGVGKSAIMTAMKIYKDLMLNRWFLRNEENEKKLSYLVNKVDESASFETEYLVKEKETINIYKFHLQIRKNNSTQLYEIVEESCAHRSPSSKYKPIYENNNGILNIKVNKRFNKYASDISRNLLKESSFLSMIFNYEHNADYKEELKVFDCPIMCHFYTYVYLDDKDLHDNYVHSEIINERRNRNENINLLNLTNSIDYLTCAHSVLVRKDYYDDYAKEVMGMQKFLQVFKPDLKSISIYRKENRDFYDCELIFEYEDYQINGEFESTGIKKLVELYTAFKRADEGQIVFIDELDANIHDYYLCKLLEYVAEYADGQLCFTTHNLGPMRVLDKYKKSIDFLSRDGDLVPWVKNGNYQVDSLYLKGLINKSPFNMESFQFLEVFGDK